MRASAFGDFIKQFFNFNGDNWGPKSTRIWRLQQYEYPTGGASDEALRGDEPDAEQAINDLAARVNSTPSSARPSLPYEDDDPSTSSRNRNSPATSSSQQAANQAGSGEDSPDEFPLAGRSFSDAGDDELSAALSLRIRQVATSSSPAAGPLDGASYEEGMADTVRAEVPAQPLSAEELRNLIYTKYGKTYDLSFVRRDIPGKTFVSLNVMWQHLEQRSFKLTEAQYMEKLDGISYLLTALGQSEHVRATLKERARSQKGLPPRPVVGTAISIRLDLDEAVIREWFGNGYQ